MSLINAKIVEVFDYKGETLHLRHQTEIKALLAPFFVGIERNFYELFGTNKIDKNIIKSVKFNNCFRYLSNNYTADEISSLLMLLRNSRNLCLHYLVRVKKQKKAFCLPSPELLNNLSFFEGAFPCEDKQLTLQGMFSVMILFMSNDQMHNFFDMLSTMPHINTGAFFFKASENKTANENALDKRNALKARFKDFNDINSETIPRKIHDNFFMAHVLSPQVSSFFLSFEEVCYKYWDIDFVDLYSPFSDLLDKLNISDFAKEKLHKCRNRWAHGQFFRYQELNDNIANEFIDLLEILTHEFNNDDKIVRYLKKKTCQFQNALLKFKYKRIVELVIKISLAEDYELSKTEERIRKLVKMKIEYPFIDEKHEEILWKISGESGVTFDFKHKISKVKDISLKQINIYEMGIDPNSYAEIYGIKLAEHSIIFSDFEGFGFPEVKVFLENGKRLNINVETVRQVGFLKIHTLKAQ